MLSKVICGDMSTILVVLSKDSPFLLELGKEERKTT